MSWILLQLHYKSILVALTRRQCYGISRGKTLLSRSSLLLGTDWSPCVNLNIAIGYVRRHCTEQVGQRSDQGIVLCSTCVHVDLRSIFKHGITESLSLAKDSHLLGDSAYKLQSLSPEIEAIWQEDQSTGSLSRLSGDDLHELSDTKRPALDIGFLDQIMHRENQCPFCRLVVALAIHSYPSLFEDLPEIATEGEKLRLAEPSERLRCFLLTFPADELRDFRSQTPELSATYLEVQFRTKGGEKLPRRRHLLQDIKDADVSRTDITSARRRPQTSFYNARLIKWEHLDIELIKSWISFCETTHTYPNCMLKSRVPEDAAKELKVIDVHSRVIITAPLGSRYMALSYVWGGANTQSDVPVDASLSHVARSHCQHLPKKLPATIEDAITLVQQLGESYLWVDSLCIDQASASDKNSQIGRMDSIYGNAFVTIIAAYGSDAESGIPGLRPNCRSHVQQQFAEIDGQRIFLSQPLLEEELDNSAWTSRGWTYQEGLLSPRCLIFAENQVFWKCAAELLSEGIAEASPAQRFWVKPPSYFELFSSSLMLLGEHSETESPNMPPPPSLAGPMPLPEFAVHVEEYTSRNISLPSDILSAFRGISNALERHFITPMLWGLPESVFDHALLWRPVTMLQESDGVRHGFPSWSWASWPGQVTYQWEITPASFSSENRAIPMHTYWKNGERRLERVMQYTEPDKVTSIDHQASKEKASSGVLQFEAEWLKIPLYPTPLSHQFCLHPISQAFSEISPDLPDGEEEEWPQPDVGENIWIDNPLSPLAELLQEKSGRECDLILMSKWDESDAIGLGMPEYDRYKEPVYNVLMVEWDRKGEEDVARRVGVGCIKVSIWEGAGAKRRRINLG